MQDAVLANEVEGMPDIVLEVALADVLKCSVLDVPMVPMRKRREAECYINAKGEDYRLRAEAKSADD